MQCQHKKGLYAEFYRQAAYKFLSANFGLESWDATFDDNAFLCAAFSEN